RFRLRQDRGTQFRPAQAPARAGSARRPGGGRLVAQIHAGDGDGPAGFRAPGGEPGRRFARGPAWSDNTSRARCPRDARCAGGDAGTGEGMSRKYFGTDGVRGTVGQSPITPDFVLRLGYAAGCTMVARRAGLKDEQRADRRAARPSVLIGKDTRISGYMV